MKRLQVIEFVDDTLQVARIAESAQIHFIHDDVIGSRHRGERSAVLRIVGWVGHHRRLQIIGLARGEQQHNRSACG
jgi:hypothetical protein